MHAITRWLAALPPARLKLVSFLGLCWLTAAVVLVTLVRGARVDADLLGAWLAFVAALGGFGSTRLAERLKRLVGREAARDGRGDG